VALSYDHRIIDGREAVTFLKSIKQKVQLPRSLLHFLTYALSLSRYADVCSLSRARALSLSLFLSLALSLQVEDPRRLLLDL
jgi:hypothetical protein